MADIIQLLPDSIANQIAAGEVIQRPASVVKELMENAVDAGATAINLILKDAGKTLIQIVDNGCGMSTRDARLSIERHATSKIRKASDIFEIRTMGFRGEALASITAIAQVEIKTRRHADDFGVRLLVENSEVQLEEACQMNPGTSISVKNLFYNVPARRNFLKSDTVEYNHILSEFQRIAMAYPDIFFSLHKDNQEIYHLPAANHKQRISSLMGSQTPKKLVDVGEDTDVVTISGFVGKPEYSKKTRGDQYFFVNNRFIRSPYLHHAVVSAFEDLLPADSHPLYAIFLEIEPQRIDINVHPTKQEIKFEDEKLIYNYLKVAVRHALGKYSIIPRMDFDQEISFNEDRLNQPADFSSSSENKPASFGSDSSSKGISFSDVVRNRHNLENWESIYEGLTTSSDDVPQPPAPTTLTLESSLQDSPEDTSNNQQAQKAPYQIHGMYIVSQIKSGFLLIDQQAAHERILYERFKQMLDKKVTSVQRQLFPKTLEFSTRESAILSDIIEDIRLLGFEVEAFGKNTFLVNGIPDDLLGHQDERALLEILIDQFNRNLELRLDTGENIARAMARSGAIRRGQILDATEMQALIDQLFACEIPFKSPSGKNCIITFDLDELARRFDHS